MTDCPDSLTQRPRWDWRATWKYAPIAAIAACYLPLLVLHVVELLADDRYMHIPLVVIAAGWLCWSRMPKPSEVRATYLATFLLMASLFVAVGSLVLASPWGMWVGAMLLLGAMAFDLFGRNTWSLFPVWLLLVFGLPFPMGIDDILVHELQATSSSWASLLLDFFQLNHLLSGNVIEVPGQKFFVEEACSGVHSLFALLALSAIFVVYERRRLVHSLLLIASAVFWSGTTNVLRIVTVVLGQAWFGIDLSVGVPHEMLGLCVFVLALCAMYCTDRLLLFAGESNSSQQAKRRANYAARQGQASVDGAKRPVVFSSWAVTCFAVLIVGVPSCVFSANRWMSGRELAGASKAAVVLDAQTLPIKIAPWAFGSFAIGDNTVDKSRGPHWATWNYASQTLRPTVSFDYPFFDGWHPLEVCYRGNGWDVRNWQVHHLSKSSDGIARDYVSFEITKVTGEKGVVLYLLFDQTGRVPTPPAAGLDVIPHWRSLILQRLAVSKQSWRYAPRYYQVQVMVTGTDQELKLGLPGLQKLLVAAQDRLVGVVSSRAVR